MNKVLLQRCVGCEIEAIFGRNGCDGTGLLLPLQNDLYVGEIVARAYYAAFVPVIAGQHPKAILPRVVDDVVNMSNGALGKGVRDIPAHAAIG